MTAWSFDMAAAPRWRRLQLACAIRTKRDHVHAWTTLKELAVGPPNPFDYAWREPSSAEEDAAPLPAIPTDFPGAAPWATEEGKPNEQC